MKRYPLERFGYWFLNQLQQPEWQRKKEETLLKNKYTCKECGSKEDVQVFHLTYILGMKPWDYPDEFLTTLCPRCLKNACKHTYVQIKMMQLTPCEKCAGVGYFSEYNETVQCLRCYGARFEEFFDPNTGHQYLEDRIVYPSRVGKKLSDSSISDFVGYDTCIRSAQLIKDTNNWMVSLYLDGGEVLNVKASHDMEILANKQFPYLENVFDLDTDSLYYNLYDKQKELIITRGDIKQKKED